MRVQTGGRKPPLRGRAIRARSPSRCDAEGAALGWLLCLSTLHMPYLYIYIYIYMYIYICIFRFFFWDFVKRQQPLLCISFFHLLFCFRNLVNVSAGFCSRQAASYFFLKKKLEQVEFVVSPGFHSRQPLERAFCDQQYCLYYAENGPGIFVYFFFIFPSIFIVILFTSYCLYAQMNQVFLKIVLFISLF
jgi:hypothetical protein